MDYQPTEYQQIVRFVSDRLRQRFGTIPTDEELGMAVSGRRNQTLAEVVAEFDRVDREMRALERAKVVTRARVPAAPTEAV